MSDIEFLAIAGPCAIESMEQIDECAFSVKSAGFNILRGGIFKPRTSIDSYQGIGTKGFKMLYEAGRKYQLKVVSEVIDSKHLDLANEYLDFIQIGSRNMYNYSLLKDVGKLNKPIILKRAFSATIEEWIKAAEYIIRSGNSNIIFCERGIRTFETYTRNTLDISAIPIIKQETGAKIIVDPSHGTGVKSLILPMSKAAIACGADGVMVEIHPRPSEALSDGKQSLNFDEFREFSKNVLPLK